MHGVSSAQNVPHFLDKFLCTLDFTHCTRILHNRGGGLYTETIYHVRSILNRAHWQASSNVVWAESSLICDCELPPDKKELRKQKGTSTHPAEAGYWRRKVSGKNWMYTMIVECVLVSHFLMLGTPLVLGRSPRSWAWLTCFTYVGTDSQACWQLSLLRAACSVR